MLLAHCIRNPSLGYTQSLNFVAAFLLLQMPERGGIYGGESSGGEALSPPGREEVTFWLLCCITEQILPDYYKQSMIGVQADNLLLAELAAEDSQLRPALQRLAGVETPPLLPLPPPQPLSLYPACCPYPLP